MARCISVPSVLAWYCSFFPFFQVVANVHQMELERRVGPVLDSQVCSPDCPGGLSCRNTAQYPANCSVR
ncbi:UNVERIFIED_CONTAM: hypothetical protein FKN15_043964 [Acipenser sinensis]